MIRLQCVKKTSALRLLQAVCAALLLCPLLSAPAAARDCTQYIHLFKEEASAGVIMAAAPRAERQTAPAAAALGLLLGVRTTPGPTEIMHSREMMARQIAAYRSCMKRQALASR